MNDRLYPEGWIAYCPECDEYVAQSDPQNNSARKTVIIDDTPCIKCITAAQQLMGRLGLPKGESNGNT